MTIIFVFFFSPFKFWPIIFGEKSGFQNVYLWSKSQHFSKKLCKLHGHATIQYHNAFICYANNVNLQINRFPLNKSIDPTHGRCLRFLFIFLFSIFNSIVFLFIYKQLKDPLIFISAFLFLG